MNLESAKNYLEKTSSGASANDIDSMPFKFFEPMIMSGLKVDLIERGRLLCSMIVPQRLLNVANSLHGGATAALVDVVGSAVIMTVDRATTTGVSVEINVSYLDAAFVGDEIEIEAKALRVGKAVAVVTVEFRNKKTGKIIAQGRHTKYLAGESSFRWALFLSKPVEKTTHVSLAPGVIPGPSSGVRMSTRYEDVLVFPDVLTLLILPRHYSDTGKPMPAGVMVLTSLKGSPLIFTFSSFFTALASFDPYVCLLLPSDSDNLDIPNVDLFDPALEAAVLPKFDMHLYQSSVTDTHVKWAAPIAMPKRHHDSSVVDPFPKVGEFSELDVERLREFVITLHKPAPRLLYAARLSHTWKCAGHVPILNNSKRKGLQGGCRDTPAARHYSSDPSSFCTLPCGLLRPPFFLVTSLGLAVSPLRSHSLP
nr:acyl-coenzyme A thioesterase 13 [Tanacetum cinerariifolium]